LLPIQALERPAIRQGEEVRFACDSPLEGERFEPSVPPKEGPLQIRSENAAVRRTHNEAL
jgi:hypothetical protein